jgi:hypothetical protein
MALLARLAVKVKRHLPGEAPLAGPRRPAHPAGSEESTLHVADRPHPPGWHPGIGPGGRDLTPLP